MPRFEGLCVKSSTDLILEYIAGWADKAPPQRGGQAPVLAACRRLGYIATRASNQYASQPAHKDAEESSCVNYAKGVLLHSEHMFSLGASSSSAFT